MSTPPRLTETDSAVRLRAVIGHIGRSLRQTSAGRELSPTQASVLTTLSRLGPLRLSELAAAEGLNPTMLSRVSAKLEARGLLERSSDPADGRVALVVATSAGKALLEKIRNERSDIVRVELGRLADEDRQRIEEALPVLEALARSLRVAR